MKFFAKTERKQALRLGGLLTPLNDNERTYFFSATYNKMSRAILEEVFDSKIESFKTMFQLTNNQTSSENYEIIGRPVTTKEILV